jgi:hypothetical protein
MPREFHLPPREKLLSFLARQRDRHIELAKFYGACFELFDLVPPTAFEDPRDARDAFILAAYTENKKFSVIRSLIRQNPNWTPLSNDSAARHAMVRYCQRLGIEPPKRK